MGKNLFIFTVSPVQGFISQARKTRDFYAASKLLSDLMDAAMEEMQKVAGNNLEIIYPHRQAKYKTNRLVAIMITDDPHKIGDRVEGKVKEKLHNKAQEILKSLSITDPPSLFREQIENYFHITWVAIPINSDPGYYKQKFTEAGLLLHSFKNIRPFSLSAQQGRKCSICGEGNALFYKQMKSRSGNLYKPKYLDPKAIAVNRFDLIRGEGLCAVCAMKRFGLKEKEFFPSVAEFALLKVIEELKKDDEGKELLKKYKKYFGEQYDPELLYEENINDDYFRKNELENLLDKLGEIKTQREKIEEYTKSKGLKLNRYYALINADADHLGSWLSGEYFEENIDLIVAQKKISEGISKYSQTLEGAFSDKSDKGKIVYAGGDDLLAFVNLHYLIEVLCLIREKYPDFQKELGAGTSSTISAGVVIAHYKTPLSEVIKQASKALRNAKKRGRRNACNIVVLKRSGEIVETIFKWEDLKPLKVAENVVNELGDKEKGFSRSFIKNFEQRFRILHDHDREGHFKAELLRLLYRSSFSKEKEEKKEKAKKYASTFTELLAKYFSGLETSSLENMVSYFKIIDFLAGEVNYASAD